MKAAARIPILTAVTGAGWETDLVLALEREAAGLEVVRRCVDIADLLATAAAGTARAALLAADLRRLDRDTVVRLQASAVAVVGLYSPGDAAAADRLHRLGVGNVLAADAGIELLAVAVTDAVNGLAEQSDPRLLGYPGAAGESESGPAPGRPAGRPADRRASRPAGGGAGRSPRSEPPRPGCLVAVWGPTGAPGRTTLAVNLAGELVARGIETLLVDADVYGGVVAQMLGMLDESPGLAAAARLANSGSLDAVALARVARAVLPGLRVLTGISRAERWPELRPAAVLEVWVHARTLATVTLVDTSFNLEEDEEIAFDTAAPRRNGLTLATLEAADVLYAVGAADPIGMQRLIRGLARLREVVPTASPRVVLNQVRRGPIGAQPERQLAAALERYVGIDRPDFVPYDREALDRALATGRTLTEVAPDSPARLAISRLAAELVDGLLEGRSAPVRHRRRL